jgi:hypothetical protein
MFNAQFSEFSYGYALTDNILHSGLPCTPHAPVFPSLYAEGTAGGYDVQIPHHPVPIFLQFKVPQIMHRRSANMPTGFWPPYMRMHLRTRRPNQHRLLRDLEAQGNEVYYTTPDFWITPDLDTYFWQQRVHVKSWYIRPSAIGPLNAKPHHVAYERGNPVGYRCSKPTRIEGRFDAEAFGSHVSARVESAERVEPTAFFQQLADRIREVTIRERPFTQTTRLRDIPLRPKEGPRDEARGRYTVSLETRRAGREAAYLSQVRLSCTLIVTGRD